MKIAVLISIARQVEGEFVLVNALKANTNADNLHRYLRQNTLPQTTEVNNVKYVIEYGVIEDLEVEEGEVKNIEVPL